MEKVYIKGYKNIKLKDGTIIEWIKVYETGTNVRVECSDGKCFEADKGFVTQINPEYPKIKDEGVESYEEIC